MKKVITYGTFDLLHTGHINLLKRARAFGDYLIVGLSTEKFNAVKHKDSFFPYDERKAILESLRWVDLVIPENTWDQKESDIRKHSVKTFVMGNDWEGKFDGLQNLCEVVYLPRTPRVSSSLFKQRILRTK